MVTTVKEALASLCPADGDVDIIDYIASILEDGDFEWGNDCEDAMDALGPVMVCNITLCIYILTPK